MLSSAQLAVFVPAALAVAASPGANNLLAFRNGLRQGLLPAAVALTGRFAAFTVMLGVVVTGLGALLHTSQTAFEVLRFLGAAVMIGLGAWVVWSARAASASDEDPPEQENGRTGGVAGWRLAAQEFVTAAANPKALLLFTAFLPPFVSSQPGAAAAGAQLVVLGALYMVCEAATALGWAAAGRVLAGHRLRPVTLRRLDQASGGALIVFGGGLALADLPRR
ncbi:LysE family translocator [Nocardiopsis deserti]|uniref:LysE family translocator n=1 Tax=Nocardiopsis deserti TaxID=2605988 RepID=UPI0012397EFF|nr:LysE family translocator [Nocardiopsis deserti]